MKTAGLSLILALLIPIGSVSASVYINEIAWMGTGNVGARGDSNDEWIELYNDAALAVDLTGWTLQAADGSPHVLLKGSIRGGGYFLLERSDDSSVPSVKADAIYSGGMENGGEVLVVRDPKGAEIDRVDGGVNWKNIGGNNDTKETPQRSSEGWITGVPTPRTLNTTAPPKVTPVAQTQPEEQVVTPSTIQAFQPETVSHLATSSAGNYFWYFLSGVVGLIGLGVLGAFTLTKSEIDEYTIIEEKDNDVSV